MGNEESHTRQDTEPDTWVDQVVDPEVEHIRSLMREKGIAVLTAYPPSNKDDFIVTQVVPEPTESQKKAISDLKNPPGLKFKIVKQPIGDIFNRHAVATYLQKIFPQKTFTLSEVELAYDIMSIIIKKCDSCENIDDIKWDF